MRRPVTIGLLVAILAAAWFFHQPISTSEPHYPINASADLHVRIGDQKYKDVRPITLVYT